MNKCVFYEVGLNNNNSPKWDTSISRQKPIYKKQNDIRSEFARDYTRILHCTAYRRLKHKTQVFYATQNDHICTRIEHVNHVASVSYTISNFLGLNTELTNAIAIGHDLGHTPFGHAGEGILNKITQKEIGERFWHEKNSLRFIDCIETLEDNTGKERNLNLTYAVRDGIICHCGEVDENALFPRDMAVDLDEIKRPNQYQPFTWEGCVVKIADKISYLGRDIEDALILDILTYSQIKELKKIIKVDISEINNTILMHDFITDLCQNSSPDNGISFSQNYLELINLVKEFNYSNIYSHKRLGSYVKYAELIINSIFCTLKELYDGYNTLDSLQNICKYYPLLSKTFIQWLNKYSNLNNRTDEENKYLNSILYDIENEKDYKRAIIDYISGMTDHFAISIFNELTSF